MNAMDIKRMNAMVIEEEENSIEPIKKELKISK